MQSRGFVSPWLVGSSPPSGSIKNSTMSYYKIKQEVFHQLVGNSFILWYIEGLNYGGFKSESAALEFLKTYRRKDNERNKKDSI